MSQPSISDPPISDPTSAGITDFVSDIKTGMLQLLTSPISLLKGTHVDDMSKFELTIWWHASSQQNIMVYNNLMVAHDDLPLLEDQYILEHIVKHVQRLVPQQHWKTVEVELLTQSELKCSCHLDSPWANTSPARVPGGIAHPS